MATQAIAHIQIHRAHRDRHVFHVAVAVGAVNAGADVRRVVKLDVSRRAESVNPLPGHIQPCIENCRELDDLRTILGEKRMTAHAELVARQTRHRAAVHAFVTSGACNLVFNMNLVSEGNRLHGRLAPAKEILHRLQDGGVGWAEYFRSINGRLIFA